MLFTVRTVHLRKGYVITEQKPEPRHLKVKGVNETSVAYAGEQVPVLEILCTDSAGRNVRRIATPAQTWAVVR